MVHGAGCMVPRRRARYPHAMVLWCTGMHLHGPLCSAPKDFVVLGVFCARFPRFSSSGGYNIFSRAICLERRASTHASTTHDTHAAAPWAARGEFPLSAKAQRLSFRGPLSLSLSLSLAPRLSSPFSILLGLSWRLIVVVFFPPFFYCPITQTTGRPPMRSS